MNNLCCVFKNLNKNFAAVISIVNLTEPGLIIIDVEKSLDVVMELVSNIVIGDNSKT